MAEVAQAVHRLLAFPSVVKVAFITTVGHNVGDDLVRDGLCHLLRQVVGPFDPLLIHKHFPASVRDGWETLPSKRWLRWLTALPKMNLERISRVLDARPLQPHRDKVLRCDVLVQSGAPVYWLNRRSASEKNEWYTPLIRRRWRRCDPRPPLINLAAGSCQPFGSDGREFAGAPKTLAFIREFACEAALTTVRDRLAQTILAAAGVTAPRLPCASIFARTFHGIVPAPLEYVALNYMPGAGHYDLAGDVQARSWEANFDAVVQELRRREPCLFVCHTERERQAVAARWPEVPRRVAASSKEVLEVYSRARWGIVNRVHGAFALASLGRPALIVGTDSRAQMGAEIGLECLFVNDATPGRLREHGDRMAREWSRFGANMSVRVRLAEAAYLRHLAEVPWPQASR